VPALKSLLDRPNPPEHIVIETSGLALPKPLVKAFNWPEIASRVTVDGVVTVVDGAAVAAGRFADDSEAIAQQRANDESLARERANDRSLDHDNPLEEVFEDQLLCADLVILNKSDLMSAQQRLDVTAEIGRTLPRVVKVVEAQNGQVPIAVLLGLGAKAEADLEGRPSHHEIEGEHDHDDFDTFIVELPSFDSPQAVIDRLSRATAAHDILRMKGFVDIAGKPMRLLVQGVGARFQHQYDRRWMADDARRGRLVVIGEKGLDKAGIEALILG
jgi:cobalamin biosynthesis protein CobW